MLEPRGKLLEQMSKVLFIGSFLSKHQGTQPASQLVADELRKFGYTVRIRSTYKSKLLRLFSIITGVVFSGYDTIHIDVFSGASFKIAELSSLIAKARRKRVILNLRGGMLPEFYAKNELRVNKLFGRSTIILSPSNYLIEFFREKGFQINYLPNSLDFSRFPFKNELSCNQSVLWVRAFSDFYSPEVAVEAFKLVHDKFPDSRMTMVGPDKGKLQETKELISSYNLSSVINITGPVKHSELSALYLSHNVFINTTRYESFGNCVFEAASSGIPIVTNRVGELPYIWSKSESVLFAKENAPKEFSEHIEKIFESPKLSEKLRLNARKTAEDFDRQRIIKMWIEILG